MDRQPSQPPPRQSPNSSNRPISSPPPSPGDASTSGTTGGAVFLSTDGAGAGVLAVAVPVAAGGHGEVVQHLRREASATLSACGAVQLGFSGRSGGLEGRLLCEEHNLHVALPQDALHPTGSRIRHGVGDQLSLQ